MTTKRRTSPAKKQAPKRKAALKGRARLHVPFATMVTSSRVSLLALVFQNQAWPNVGDAGGLQPSATAGHLYISLHTAPVGAAGNQTTNETAYTGYARQPVSRDMVEWLLTSPSPTQVANALQILFGACTGSPGADITDFAVGLLVSGAGQVIATGAIDTPLPMLVGVQPVFPVGDLTVNVT